MKKGHVAGLVVFGLFAFVAMGNNPTASAETNQGNQVGDKDAGNTASKEASSTKVDEGSINKGKKDKRESCHRVCDSLLNSCLSSCKRGNDGKDCRRTCEDQWMTCDASCK